MIQDPADILEAAAEFLEQNEWGKRNYVAMDFEGVVRYCAVGALRQFLTNEVINLDTVFVAAYQALTAAAVEETGSVHYVHGMRCPGWGIEHWNDNHAQDKHEVIDLMKHTAKDLRNRKAAA